MSAAWCRKVAEQAFERYGRPQLFNTDQGSQFTSKEFLDVLRQNQVQISMDGKGRCKDNLFKEQLWRSLKYESVYLYLPESTAALYEQLNVYSQRNLFAGFVILPYLLSVDKFCKRFLM